MTELVDVLNGLFSCIDFAAKCIGNVWKVETIGDCYIAVVGGPQVCSCRLLQGVAGCCSVLQCIAVCGKLGPAGVLLFFCVFV